MGRLWLTVQHCVLARVVRRYGPHPTSDLLGVDYYLVVPADTEFPRTVGTLELFVRFFARNPKPTRVGVAITRLNPDGGDGDRVYRDRLDLAFPQQTGHAMMDVGLKMPRVRLTGEGRYAVRVLHPGRRDWRGKRVRRVLAAEYFIVVRSP